MKVTLAVITFNEQQHIGELLSSVYDMFDEIVIVDGASIDKTIKIIEDFRLQRGDEKIKLYIKPQRGPRYSRSWQQSLQRNWALDKCTGDWIFTIDADERIDRDTRRRLESLIEANPKQLGFAMPTHHYWDTKDQIRIDGKWYPDYHYRAWKNGEDIKYSPHRRHCFPRIPDHPEVRGKTEKQTGVPYTDIVIHHYHHVPIKNERGVYRANNKEVRSQGDLEKGLELRKI